MRHIAICLTFALVLSACPLRPRYTDFITRRTEAKSVTFVITDEATGKPIPNARVEVSELRNRIQLVTAADGTFTLPVEKKYIDEDPVFVVTLPAGFRTYRLSPVAAPAPILEAPPAPPAPPAAPAPVENAADAGVSNG